MKRKSWLGVWIVVALTMLGVDERALAMAKKTEAGNSHTALTAAKFGVSADLSFGLTEAYAAERFADDYGDALRYDHVRRLWFVFQSPLWVPDPDGQVTRCAIKSARTLQHQAESIEEEATKKKIMSFCKYLQSEPGIRRVLKIAMNLPPLANKGGRWDLDPWLLGVPNGVIDLRSGRLRRGRPEDLLTLSTGVRYDARATCPRWRQFLEEVFCNNRTLIRYIQRCVGYTLTGLTTEQTWWLLHGSGANGKSVFLGVLAHVLDSYAQTIPFNALTLPERSIPDELADLPGKRLAFASEAIEGARLNEARIKAITGGDRLAVRHLYGRWFRFQPNLKLCLTCNHMPTVQDTSPGFWRRLQLVRFERTFDQQTRDARLLETLKAEGSGILRWAVLGCRTWDRAGLQTPSGVTDASQQYRRDSDQVGQFIDERCEEDPEVFESASKLYTAYQAWARDHGYRGREVLSQTAFGTRMGGRFERQHMRGGDVYVGMRLR